MTRPVAAGYLGATAVAALLVTVSPWPPGSWAGGLLLVLLLPGSAWITACGMRPTVPGATLAFSVAASFGLTMAVGLVLDAAPGGLTTTGWAIGLAAATAAGVLVAVVRGPQPAMIRPAWPGWRPALGTLLLAVTVLGVVGAIVVISRGSQATWTARQHLTELGIRRIDGRPVVTVTNREGGPVRYRVEVSTARRPAATYTAIVPDEGRWERAVGPASSGSSARPAVRVTLYRAGEPAPYRVVTLKGDAT